MSYAANITDRAILGLPAMRQLGCWLTAAVVGVITQKTENIVHHFQKPKVRRVFATSKVTNPARSETIITGEIQRKLNGQTILINDKKREDNEEIKLLVVPYYRYLII